MAISRFFRQLVICSFSFLLSGSALLATPAQVILLRHGEKPASGDSLSPTGFKRAAMLATYFTGKLPFAMSTPIALYAQRSSKNHSSTRPVQTIAPLANVWQLPLYTSYSTGDYKKLVDDVMSNSDYDGKMVMVCWSRGNLGNIASAFGVQDAPIWPKGVYNHLWIITFSGNSVSSFQNLLQPPLS
jgi:hypothetical protein